MNKYEKVFTNVKVTLSAKIILFDEADDGT